MRANTPAAAADPSDDAVDSWQAARAWARSGVMALNGNPTGPPLLPPLGAATRLTAVAEEIARLTAARGRPVGVRWEAALSGRAAILGLAGKGRTSANGSCRLITAGDGEVALNLPRRDDLSLVPALTLDPAAEDGPWDAAATLAASMPAAEFVGRARLLGLAASMAGERPSGPAYVVTRRGEPTTPALNGGWTVVDLSSLWAGPVAARVLAESGAHLIKVEDPARPDAARQRPEFYSWIHPVGEKTEQVDFTSESGRQTLSELLESADVVIESSRPRALEQIGLAPDQLRGAAGQVWLSITGHGRTSTSREWTGFGDDCAVAGGLHCRDESGMAAFCGDAVADPVTGLVGALAVLRCLAEGGGHLLDVSLSGAAAWAAAGGEPDPRQHGITVDRSGEGWVVHQGDLVEPVAARPPTLDWV